MKNTLLLCLAGLTALCLIQCKKNKIIVNNPAVNYADSVKANLWARYTFSNSLADSSGSNHVLTPMNGVALGSDKTGAANSALLFDGTNDFAVIDDGKSFPEGSFTVSLWMNPSKTTGGRIFNKADFNNGTSPTINMGFDDDNANNRLSFSMSNSTTCNTLWTPGSATNLLPPNVFTPNTWYHLVTQHKDGMLRMYINGQLIGATATPRASFTACSNAPWYFGIWWTGGMFPYKGTMDNIRIYTRAISENEIKWLNDNYK
jgi:hypothetical protein